MVPARLAPVTLTLSNVAVLSAVLSCAVTARPAVAPIVMATFVPASGVQATPLVEYDAVNVLPARTSFNHCGGVAARTQPTTLIVAAPAAGRTCIATPLVGVSNTETSMPLVA